MSQIDDEQLDEIIENAGHAIFKAIQDRLGIDSGDNASVFASGNEFDKDLTVRKYFRSYIEFEEKARRNESSGLAEQMEALFPRYKTWRFEYLYPGYFTYYSDAWRVFFTPNRGPTPWQDIMIDPQIQTINGRVENRWDGLYQLAQVSFDDQPTPKQLFKVAKGLMDLVDATA